MSKIESFIIKKSMPPHKSDREMHISLFFTKFIEPDWKFKWLTYIIDNEIISEEDCEKIIDILYFDSLEK